MCYKNFPKVENFREVGEVGRFCEVGDFGKVTKTKDFGEAECLVQRSAEIPGEVLQFLFADVLLYTLIPNVWFLLFPYRGLWHPRSWVSICDGVRAKIS